MITSERLVTEIPSYAAPPKLSGNKNISACVQIARRSAAVLIRYSHIRLGHCVQEQARRHHAYLDKPQAVWAHPRPDEESGQHR